MDKNTARQHLIRSWLAKPDRMNFFRLSKLLGSWPQEPTRDAVVAQAADLLADWPAAERWAPSAAAEGAEHPIWPLVSNAHLSGMSSAAAQALLGRMPALRHLTVSRALLSDRGFCAALAAHTAHISHLRVVQGARPGRKQRPALPLRWPALVALDLPTAAYNPGECPALHTLRIQAETIRAASLRRCLESPWVATVRSLTVSARKAEPGAIKALGGRAPQLRTLDWHAPCPDIAAMARLALSSLRALSLRSTGLGREGLSAIAAAPWFAGLRALFLDNNPIGLAGVRAIVQAQPPLETLSLYGCRLGPRAVGLLGGFVGLVELAVGGNPIKDRGLDALVRTPFPRLTTLGVSFFESGITGGPARLAEAQWPALQRLECGEALSTGEQLALLEAPGFADAFTACWGRFSWDAGATEGAWRRFVSNPRTRRLRQLRFERRGPPIPVAWLEQLAEISFDALDTLYIARPFEADVPAATWRLLLGSPAGRALETLGITHDPGGDAVLQAVISAPLFLRSLHLERCGVTSAGVRALAASPLSLGLESLGLRGNPIDDDGAQALADGDFPVLYHLDVLQCQLTRDGTIPLRGASFPAMEQLTLPKRSFRPRSPRAALRRPWVDPLASLAEADQIGDRTVVLSGRFPVPHSTLRTMLRAAGIATHHRLRRAADLLVVGEAPGPARLERAQALGCPWLAAPALMAAVGEAMAPEDAVCWRLRLQPSVSGGLDALALLRTKPPSAVAWQAMMEILTFWPERRAAREQGLRKALVLVAPVIREWSATHAQGVPRWVGRLVTLPCRQIALGAWMAAPPSTARTRALRTLLGGWPARQGRDAVAERLRAEGLLSCR